MMIHFWLDPTYDIEVSDEENEAYRKKLEEWEEEDKKNGYKVFEGGGW